MTSEQPQPSDLHRVVVVGAGFGGLQTTHRLKGAPVQITLVDRRNHHLFQPLLYQVATASLATSEIAWPIRYLLRDRPEVTTLFATVSGVDATAKRVLRGYGTIISFDVRGGADAADAVCRNLGLIHHATSLGAVESTIERRAAIPGQGHLPPSLLRLSVGIEDVDDLWKDLDAALRATAA